MRIHLRDIAQNMNEYYRETPTKVNLAPSITAPAARSMMLGAAIHLTVSRIRRGV